MLKFKKSVYEARIPVIVDLINKLNENVTEYENLKAKIPSYWEGEQAEDAIKQINLSIAACKAQIRDSNEVLENLKKAVSQIEDTHAAVGAVISSAMSKASKLKS